jgi:hypothetical protein
MENAACAALLMALLYKTGSALGAEGEPATSDLGRNAALTYWRAFADSPEMTKDEQNIISPRPGAEPKATWEQKAELARRWDQALQLMHQAAAIPQCNWGIDYEKEGPGARLGHLSKARALTRAAAFRARYYWEVGRRKDAVEDLRATVIMARQAGNDGRDTVIAMLVQIAIEKNVQRTIGRLLTDREAADLFADVLGDFSKGCSPLLIKNAILSEKRYIIWIRRLAESEPNIGMHLADELRADPSSASQAEKEAEAKLRQLQRADVLNLAGELGKQYDELAAISAMPFVEFQAKLPALLERVKASENPLSVLWLLSLRYFRDEDEKCRIGWAMVRAAIEFRREGEKGLSKITEPQDGVPFQYTALEGGAFELKSALPVRGENIVMTFGQPPAAKD